jgi:hypothetical protein
MPRLGFKPREDLELSTLKVGNYSNQFTISEDGSILLLNTATQWDDLRGPASGINPVGSPSAATPNTSDGSLTFAKGNVAIAWFQLPHAWKVGSDIFIHIHWSKATSASGNVNWQMQYKWANIGSGMPAFSALTSGTHVISDANTADLHALTSWPAVAGTGKTISSMICVYISRTNNASDTYTGNANLYEIDIHYEVDSFGSREESIK